MKYILSKQNQLWSFRDQLQLWQTFYGFSATILYEFLPSPRLLTCSVKLKLTHLTFLVDVDCSTLKMEALWSFETRGIAWGHGVTSHKTWLFCWQLLCLKQTHKIYRACTYLNTEVCSEQQYNNMVYNIRMKQHWMPCHDIWIDWRITLLLHADTQMFQADCTENSPRRWH